MIMKEMKIFLDKNKESRVKDSIQFDEVVAGKKTIKSIYLLNNLNYYMDVDLEIVGTGIKVLKKVKYLEPMEFKKVDIEFTPKITTMKPITAKLKIKLGYLIA